jgi:hypothetical protein
MAVFLPVADSRAGPRFPSFFQVKEKVNGHETAQRINTKICRMKLRPNQKK